MHQAQENPSDIQTRRRAWISIPYETNSRRSTAQGSHYIALNNNLCKSPKIRSDVDIYVKHTLWFFLFLIIFSIPLKAPDATNIILVVSTGTVSPRIFLDDLSGTLTTVPSNIFKRPYKVGSDV